MNFSTTTTSQRTPFLKNSWLIILAISFIAIWIYRYINNIDKTDWYLENILVAGFVVYIMANYKKFKYSDLSYVAFFLFLMLHIYGAQYAYTSNPIGAYFKNEYQLWRNPYDRVVHFSFGLFLIYPLRELLIVKFNTPKKYVASIALIIMLGLASLFELIEWAVYECTPKETGVNYVATQGDEWDPHKDIVLAVLGGAITLVFIAIIKNFRKKK
jgi:putative membrane protein